MDVFSSIFNMEAKCNFRTHSDLSFEIKDLEQIKTPERILTLIWNMIDCQSCSKKSKWHMNL